VKTLAIQLEDDLHAQLSAIVQLASSTMKDELRQAIEAHVGVRRSDPELLARAEAARVEIEREAAARQAALAELLGAPQAAAESSKSRRNGRSSREGSPAS
jgi:hypothetical protein